ncbi:unnamed protein product [Amoebophrya sp. A25]|nr:unnamed protein product [Amoebophrya sp. A25]|eukprot:GSA25T00026925001.1
MSAANGPAKPQSASELAKLKDQELKMIEEQVTMAQKGVDTRVEATIKNDAAKAEARKKNFCAQVDMEIQKQAFVMRQAGEHEKAVLRQAAAQKKNQIEKMIHQYELEFENDAFHTRLSAHHENRAKHTDDHHSNLNEQYSQFQQRRSKADVHIDHIVAPADLPTPRVRMPPVEKFAQIFDSAPRTLQVGLIQSPYAFLHHGQKWK